MNNLEQILPGITEELTNTLYHDFLLPVAFIILLGIVYLAYRFVSK